MGLKRLSQSLLISLAIFAGAAELRAHATPAAKVSPNLPIVQNRQPLQKKNFAQGFSAYLRHSARSLGGSFVSAVKTAQTDRALALKKAANPAKRAAHETKANLANKKQHFHGQIAQIKACANHEDLPRAESGARAVPSGYFTAGRLAQVQLWISIARAPDGLAWRLQALDLGASAPMGSAIASPRATHGEAEAVFLAECWSKGLAAVKAGEPMVRRPFGQSARGAMPDEPCAMATGATRTPQADPAGALAVSKAINPPIKSSKNATQAVSGRVIASLG
ncbi:hypothetical protein Turpa_0005 (plasmid) [Turneriella parva DSM 21527]|uniref:Uncharacterized protein n=1 Tax=Turneriella parva (strain ATCC BAA-1111 / DSM 21527 / NCTC 11395 / H) TaxID=869212 RepID=I4BC00_TURPD|nr:hypothetical protein Turpa_0005 [Turneriella parva DSM 21527]